MRDINVSGTLIFMTTNTADRWIERSLRTCRDCGGWGEVELSDGGNDGHRIECDECDEDGQSTPRCDHCFTAIPGPSWLCDDGRTRVCPPCYAMLPADEREPVCGYCHRPCPPDDRLPADAAVAHATCAMAHEIRRRKYAELERVLGELRAQVAR